MPKLIFKYSELNQQDLPLETIVGLENFTLLNPSIDSGSGRARQMVFAISEFFAQLTSQTEYKKGEAKFQKYSDQQRKKNLEEQEKIIAEQERVNEGMEEGKGQIKKMMEQVAQEAGRDLALEEQNIITALEKNLEQSRFWVGESKKILKGLKSSPPAKLDRTAFDNKYAFREGILESHAFVLKQLKLAYGVEWQQWEILAAKFAGLTGIIAPNTLMAIDAQDEDHRKKSINELKQRVVAESAKSLQIASQRLRGYCDLSGFLLEIVNQFPHELLRAEDMERYRGLREQILSIQKRDDAKSADNKEAKAYFYLEIYKLLPAELKDQINELRVVSSWIGNWDMFNWDLDNCGFCVRHFKEGKTSKVSIEPAMVDFGNSLFNGFGGIYKHLSGEKVNKPAKLFSEKPQDFDPIINEPDQVIEQLIGFRKDGAADLLLGRFPRKLPFQEMFREENQHLVKFLSDSKDFDIEQISQGTLRGLYRIASISDQAIEKMVRKWYVFEGEQLFNKIEENAQDQDFRNKLSPDYLIELMKARRDDFVDKFKPLIRRYENIYGVDAIETKREIDAVAIDISLVKPNSFTTETSAQRLSRPIRVR